MPIEIVTFGVGGHQCSVDFRRYVRVFVHPAVCELDLKHQGQVIVANGADY